MPDSGTVSTLEWAEAQTVTLLFTDIEGSTVRWETKPEAMTVALRLHDRLLRHAIESNVGRVFKTVGDAFYAVFEQTHHAVAAALDGQRALAAYDWSEIDGLLVRMAVHVGPVESRDDDFFGPTLNRVARLLAIAHGGQTVLSEAAAASIKTLLPSETSVIALGEHRLKDLAHPEFVFQLSSDGLRSLFPPLRSLSVLPNNLPPSLTSFVGRAADLAETRRILESTRLLTITATGGVGKTRLALALGSELLGSYQQGVFFVEFAALTGVQFVVDAVATAVGSGSSIASTAERHLIEFLKTRRILLIFDNCEHLIAEVARLAHAILRSCPEVSIVATSREPLRITGERCYQLPSLEVPSERDDATFAEIDSSEAVSLFVSRAKEADRRFVLTEANAVDVAAICRHLDGIALAIELAAARVPMLSIASLRARITGRLALLTRGNRTVLPRQQTVRALIDWSYDLLDDPERRLFESLSVFTDSFSLEAAIAVGGADDDDVRAMTLDVLSQLVDKSMVATEIDDRDGAMRYRLLETIREYGREKLGLAGCVDATFDRFVEYAIAFVERSFTLWAIAPSKAWEAFASPEIPNVRAAFDRMLASERDRQRGIATIARARRLFARIAPTEGGRWLAAARTAAGDATPTYVAAELELADAQMLTALQQSADALAASERAIALYDSLGDELGLAEARGFAGLALTMLGSSERGESLLHEAIATYDRYDARQLHAYALSDLGLSSYFSGREAEAIAILRDARDAFLVQANERAAVATTSNLSAAAFGTGNVRDALLLIAEAIAGDTDSRYGAVLHANKAMYLTALDRFDEAREAARTALRRSRGATADVEIVTSLKHLAAIAALRGDGISDHAEVALAARLFAAAERYMSELGAVVSPPNAIEDRRARVDLERKLGIELLSRLEDDGRSWPLASAIAAAGSL